MHLNLRFIGNSILHVPSEPFSDEELSRRSLKKIAACMHEHMVSYEGVGLAGPQIGIARRVFCYDDQQGHKGICFNPVLKTVNYEKIIDIEGCLSVPGHSYPTPRFREVLLKGIDINGKDIKLRASGYLARIFQHEIDHLNGRLYIDYLPNYIFNSIKLGGNDMECGKHVKENQSPH